METREFKNKQVHASVHSEQLQDVIGKPPLWLYRWGISIVSAATIICIAISSFIQYPETIQTKIKIISASTTQLVTVPNSTVLLKIFVKNNEHVKKGQVLALCKNIHGEVRIASPDKGDLTYAGIIRESEQLKPGRTIFRIRQYSDDLYGEMDIPLRAVGKIKPGQTVLIKLKNDQGEEQQMLKGIIKYITAKPINNEEYVAEVDFPDHNTFFASNPYRGDMTTVAEIVTTSSTMLSRIFKSITNTYIKK